MSRKATHEFRFQIYGPTVGRNVFRIVKLFYAGGAETVQDSEIEKVNEQFKARKLSKDEAWKKMEAIVYRLKGIDPSEVVERVVSPTNDKIIKKYFASEKLSERAAYAIKRAVAQLGTVDLLTGTKRQMEKALSHLTATQKNRAVNRINTLLRSLGRDFVLAHEEEEKAEIKYLTLPEFKKFLTFLEDPGVRLLHEVCFYTGTTVGEAFGLDGRSFRPDDSEIRISNIQFADGTKKETKQGDRTSIVIPDGNDKLLAWFKAKKSIDSYVHANVSRFTRKAAMQAFPGDPSKHITFTDLRNCYAMHLLSKGVPLALVATCLGVNEKYAKETFPKFDLGSESLNLVKKILKVG